MQCLYQASAGLRHWEAERRFQILPLLCVWTYETRSSLLFKLVKQMLAESFAELKLRWFHHDGSKEPACSHGALDVPLIT